MMYFRLPRTEETADLRRFLQIAATTIPCSFLLKSALKYCFGRTTTRNWLANHVPLQFHWFHPIDGGGFPSGHMAVFTALGAAVWFSYPQYRRMVIIFLALLGTALILTDYHFLSDVIAGAYLGIVVDHLVRLGSRAARTTAYTMTNS